MSESRIAVVDSAIPRVRESFFMEHPPRAENAACLDEWIFDGEKVPLTEQEVTHQRRYAGTLSDPPAVAL